MVVLFIILSIIIEEDDVALKVMPIFYLSAFCLPMSIFSHDKYKIFNKTIRDDIVIK